MSKKKQDYNEFIDKFKPKLTTDDCYTPLLVYDAVLRWAKDELNICDRPVVRPFWPGGDFEHYDYPEGCVVIDNPPFSIFTKIVRFYTERGIDFLLFAPSLLSIRPECTFIGTGTTVIYENGAQVGTSFVTNMLGDLICTTAPDLHEAVKAADAESRKDVTKQVAKLAWPPCVLRATTLHTMAHAGVRFSVRGNEGRVICKASNQKKGDFGSSILLSDKAVKERMAAERMAAERMAAERLAAERMAAERIAAERITLNGKAIAILDELNGKA